MWRNLQVTILFQICHICQNCQIWTSYGRVLLNVNHKLTIILIKALSEWINIFEILSSHKILFAQTFCQFQVEEDILQEYAWKHESPLWEVLKDGDQGAPSCEDVSLPHQTDKPGTQSLTRLASPVPLHPRVRQLTTAEPVIVKKGEWIGALYLIKGSFWISTCSCARMQNVLVFSPFSKQDLSCACNFYFLIQDVGGFFYHLGFFILANFPV